MPGPRHAFAAVLLAVLACAAAVPASAQTYSPGDTFRDCPTCPEMVVIPPGSFQMGSTDEDIRSLVSDEGGKREWYFDEMPQDWVTIARAFAAGRYEVTFDEWDACVAAGGCGHRPFDEGWSSGDRPVIDITWNDVQDYVAWLSRETGQRYRLLTEAEWEYAARAGTRTRYWWGDAIGRGNANCDGCGSRWDGEQTAPVGSFAANPFALYDVHGNVMEWVEDCWHYSYSDAPSDAIAWTGSPGCDRVLRGGSWGNFPRHVRSANRDWFVTGNRSGSIGFRVARDLD